MKKASKKAEKRINHHVTTNLWIIRWRWIKMEVFRQEEWYGVIMTLKPAIVLWVSLHFGMNGNCTHNLSTWNDKTVFNNEKLKFETIFFPSQF